MELENFNFDPTDFTTEALAKNGTETLAKPKEEAPKEGAEEDTVDFDETSLLDFSDQFESTKEEDKPKEKPGKDHSQETKDNSSSPNHMLVFAKALEESGLISDFTDEEFEQLTEETGSPTEAIIELVNKTIGATINEHINNADEEYKEFVRMRDSGVDLNEYAKISKQARGYASYKLEDVKEDESLQKKVVAEALKLTGMPDDEITDTIESYEDTGKLGKRAESAVAKLNKFKEDALKKLELEAKQAEQKQAEAVQQQLASIRKSIDDTTEIIPGIKHNKQTKDKLFDMITKPAGVINGQQVNAITLKMHENPTKFNLILAEMIRLGIFDGKWDSITKVSKTKAITDLEKVVNSNTSYTAGEKNDYVSKVYDKIRNMK